MYGTTVRVDYSCKCAFCDGRIAISYDTCAVFHTMPPCEKFEDNELDSLEFIEACNEKLRNEKEGKNGK